MTNIQRDYVTPKWLKIKEMYEKGTNGSSEYGENFPIGGELDKLCDEFVDLTGILTQRFGYNCKIEGIKMDLWKERIWNLIENAGLLMPLPRHMEDKEEILTDENIEEIVDEIVELGPTEEDIQMIDELIPELEESFMEELKTEE